MRGQSSHATGGFGATAEMAEKYKPELKRAHDNNAEGAQGQGIDMATAVGAYSGYGSSRFIQTVHSWRRWDAHPTEGSSENAEGKRFYDEVSTRDKVSAAIIELHR